MKLIDLQSTKLYGTYSGDHSSFLFFLSFLAARCFSSSRFFSAEAKSARENTQQIKDILLKCLSGS